LRRLFLSSLVFSFTVFGSIHARADNGAALGNRLSAEGYENARWRNLSTNEKIMLDRVAANFFEANLRLTQSRQIEASTAGIYVALTENERTMFREERRRTWRAMRDDERNALRNVKLPAYSNLTEGQKAPFRQIALDQLAPESATQTTPQAALRSGNDI
jgi:hypothetical protein